MSKRKTGTTSSSGTKGAATKTAKAATSTKSKTRTAGSRSKSTSRKRTVTIHVSAEERFRMIQEAAYFNAMSGNSQDEIGNWLRAEQEIDSRLNM